MASSEALVAGNIMCWAGRDRQGEDKRETGRNKKSNSTTWLEWKEKHTHMHTHTG